VAKIQKLNYKGYQIEKVSKKYYFAGQAFDSLGEAQDEIDEFLKEDWGQDDGEEQRLFEEYWQSQNY
jgi:hypothetical protein